MAQWVFFKANSKCAHTRTQQKMFMKRDDFDMEKEEETWTPEGPPWVGSSTKWGLPVIRPCVITEWDYTFSEMSAGEGPDA